VIEGRRYLFLDMPGFDVEDTSDFEIFRLLMLCISTIRLFVKFTGILYVDGLKNNRMTLGSSKVLDWLYEFCGEEI
jgi:hypothetical protein